METRKATRAREVHTGAMVSGAVATIVVTCSLILFGAFWGMRRVSAAEAFAPGTQIDGVAVGGLSFAEGERSVGQALEAQLGNIQIPLSYNGATKVFTAGELGISTNVEALLDQAYSRNKNGALLADFDLSHAPYSARSELILDEGRMAAAIEAFLRANDIPALEASASFDPASRSFSYTPESKGMQADTQKVINAVKAQLAQADYRAIQVDGRYTQPVEPVRTQADLERNTALIGACVTMATDDENRNANIRLMCEAVDGLAIPPGETLSLNELVGQRTEAKGFRAAGSIVDGQLADSIGGGICQLAGTLYNAALLADMEIVERVHHTWPSEYLPIGLDATLNWDNKDLKLKNRSSYPIFISARLEDLTVTVQIYGEPPANGIEIDVDNQITKEIEAPQPEIIYTNKLMAGAERVKVRSRKGYEVVVTRRYWKDGELVGTELIAKDHFRAMRGTTLIGTDDTIK